MSKRILVKFKSDWADEFDVYGFQVFTEDEYKQWISDLNEVNWPQEVYFGTNEEFEFNSLEEYQQKIQIQTIDEKEYEVLKKLFGNKYSDILDWGNFIDPSYH